MMRWIRKSPSVCMCDEETKEIPYLTNNFPLKLAARFQTENPDHPRVKNGIKHIDQNRSLYLTSRGESDCGGPRRRLNYRP
mmetsp:Transcript_13157/g.19390  ORF Transcript_13157/g.19390 Transcript_13157/m.19390 type:complete len:81 (-) Transcript_13157:79-321(-)